MTRSIVSIAAVVYLFALAGLTAVAQQLDSPRTPGGFSVEFDLLEYPKADVVEEMTEHMAVMKRILDETLEEVYRTPGAMSLDERKECVLKMVPNPGLYEVVVDSPRNRIPDALSAYLEGYGVVYQVIAPPPGEEPKMVEVDAAAAKRFTYWEAARQRVLGTPGTPTNTQHGASGLVPDSIQSPPPSPFPTRSRLTEMLLEVLADNGHNFRHLAPDERLTVALTFRKNRASSGSRPKTSRGVPAYGSMGLADFGGGYGGSASSTEANEDYGGVMGMGMGGMMEDTGEGDDMGAMGAMGGMMGAAVGGGEEEGSAMGMYGMGDQGGYSGMMSGYRPRYAPDPDLTAGDLHLRQGNYKKAVEAYEKNVRKRVKKDPYKHQPTGSLVAVYQKLAQAQVGAGDYAKAQQLIDAIHNARPKPASPEKSEPRFPAQLVISTTKGDLDQVAAGKMTFEEFKKKATARYFDPRSVEAESDDAARRTTTRFR